VHFPLYIYIYIYIYIYNQKLTKNSKYFFSVIYFVTMIVFLSVSDIYFSYRTQYK
jgi:hypothetical protein